MRTVGDASAPDEFAHFYLGSHARLVGQLSAITADVAAAEDLVQEAFLRAYERWTHVANLDSPELWVRQVAVRLSISRWRRLRTARERAPRAARAVEPSGDAVDLLRALAALTPAQRAVIVLHHVCDLSVAEIAAELRRPTGTVKAQLSRGRRRLADLLRDEEAFDART